METMDEKLTLALVAALSALLGVFLSSSFSRSQKISEFRQAWINSLRIIFIDTLECIDKYLDLAYTGDKEEVFHVREKINTQLHKISMHMNRNEKKYKDLVDIISGLRNKYEGVEGRRNIYEIDKNNIAELMQDILKDEWERVRDGEFQWSVKKMKEYN